MTENQLKYLIHQETQRHNLATEQDAANRTAESVRSNLMQEEIAIRSNEARETETNRSNIAREKETNRHNTATERLATADFVVSSLLKGFKEARETAKSITDIAQVLGMIV